MFWFKKSTVWKVHVTWTDGTQWESWCLGSTVEDAWEDMLYRKYHRVYDRQCIRETRTIIYGQVERIQLGEIDNGNV